MGHDKQPDEEDFVKNPLLQDDSTRISESLVDLKEINQYKRIYFQLKDHAKKGLIELDNIWQNLDEGQAAVKIGEISQ